jgi:DNA-binding HxlR family transcriptional regulator
MTDCRLQSDWEAGFMAADASRHRSGCPINLATEVLGDKWSLVVLRDVMFGDRRYFRELLTRSEEGIASNILSARLQRLVETGLLTRGGDESHRQKVRYSLTEAAIQLVPVMVALGGWGSRQMPADPRLAARSAFLERGGQPLRDRLMAELRESHLGIHRPDGSGSVLAEFMDAESSRVRLVSPEDVIQAPSA